MRVGGGNGAVERAREVATKSDAPAVHAEPARRGGPSSCARPSATPEAIRAGAHARLDLASLHGEDMVMTGWWIDEGSKSSHEGIGGSRLVPQTTPFRVPIRPASISHHVISGQIAK